MVATGWAVDVEVHVHLGAHVLADVADDRQSLRLRDLGTDRRVLHVLGPDAENDLTPLEAIEPGIALERRVGETEPIVAEAGPQVAVRPRQLGLDEIHRRRADELGDEEIPRAVVEDPAARPPAGGGRSA